MAVEFNGTARRVGIFSAAGYVVLGVAYAVTLAPLSGVVTGYTRRDRIAQL